jgi:hypothetical protein
MKRSAVVVFVVAGSMLVASGGGAFAAKTSKSSKSAGGDNGGSKSRNAQIEKHLDAEFGPKNAPPVKYENEAHNVRFTAPGCWKIAAGGCPGSIYNLFIRPDVPAPGPDGTVSIRPDIFTVAVNPAKSPSAGLDEAVKDVQEEVKKGYPKAEFKPVEKTKVAGVEAQVVTAFMPARNPGDPKKAEQHVVFVRDGKVFQMILYAQANTLAKQTKAVQQVAKSFDWTGDAAAPVAATTDSTAKPKPGNNDGFDN